MIISVTQSITFCVTIKTPFFCILWNIITFKAGLVKNRFSACRAFLHIIHGVISIIPAFAAKEGIIPKNCAALPEFVF